MSGFVQVSDRITQLTARVLVAGAVLAWGTAATLADAPKRVVSINLCTDQLAMLLADEGQLLSVSRLALDRNVSPMVEEAQDYVINYGQAEEVFMLQPDLVLAGVFTPPHTVNMLENLGIPVEIFDITKSIADVRDRVAQMGEALHREDAATAMIAGFDARLAALQVEPATRPNAMLYYANGFTSGEDTMANEILELAGFNNAAIEAGYNWGRKMPLEILALTNPDLVITTRPYPGGSRAEDVMDHPVVEAIRDTRASAVVPNHDWICGTPFVLRAAETLAQVRRDMETGAQ